MSATTTAAPSSAKRTALARPIPDPAPVTIATFSSSSIRACWHAAGAPAGPAWSALAVGVAVVPVGEQRAQRGEQHERLVEHRVVAGLGQLDHRRDAAERLVHLVADVRGDEAVLGAQQGEAAVDLRRGSGRAMPRMPPPNESKIVRSNFHCQPPSTGVQRAAGDVVDDVVEVVRCGGTVRKRASASSTEA